MNVLTKGVEMGMVRRALHTRGSLLFLWGVILVSLQGCHYAKPQPITPPKITENSEERGPIVDLGGDDDCGAKGCDPKSYAGSAKGFLGVGGPNPVPAGYTCNTGSVMCRNEGNPGCSLRYPKKVCKSTFTYQSGKTTGPCSCECLFP